MTSTIRFTTEHEWVRLEDDGSMTVGITEHAQDALGDVVYIELPELKSYTQGEEVAVIESVKAASNIDMPLDGEVIVVNDALEAAPETVNEDAMGAGWFFKMQAADSTAFDTLLDQAGYDAFIRSL
ncbi:glycine cleavage system protein GcvH [Acinetobacter sp. MD2]|uniref:glycine cleavage system protein GcvH n=1 Tax=Acinetobacter sp. MD2 TaxID=2600066 RepID=UPI002D1F5E79|nr:glycine cleavage system protein GcvH [Acinetobacter sp. MD2]MEB3767422.1 glycine cleavage system protein GcvH [Acinetobacter sp. MD2]